MQCGQRVNRECQCRHNKSAPMLLYGGGCGQLPNICSVEEQQAVVLEVRSSVRLRQILEGQMWGCGPVFRPLAIKYRYGRCESVQLHATRRRLRILKSCCPIHIINNTQYSIKKLKKKYSQFMNQIQNSHNAN